MRAALAFLTPLGRPAEPTPDSLAWFPVVGALLGLALGGIWWVADRLWLAPVAAAVVVVADLALTGMLHADGLADSADGLLPPMPALRRPDVMASPEVGAFGVAALAGVLLVRWSSLVVLQPSALLLAALWCTSRTAMALTAARVPYARTEGGLASAFLGGRPEPALAGGALAAAVLAAWWAPAPGLAAVAASTLAAGAVVALAWRRIGGFTGDVLGASGMIGETAGLVVAAARW